MGGRLSKQQAADGLSETKNATIDSAKGRLGKSRGIITGRTVMAPLAAFTMASILFVYTRTSIRAAKLNAQKHREADGGQISWHNESLRRHGQLDKVENDRGTFKEALMSHVEREKKDTKAPPTGDVKTDRSNEEDKLRKLMGKDE